MGGGRVGGSGVVTLSTLILTSSEKAVCSERKEFSPKVKGVKSFLLDLTPSEGDCFTGMQTGSHKSYLSIYLSCLNPVKKTVEQKKKKK